MSLPRDGARDRGAVCHDYLDDTIDHFHRPGSCVRLDHETQAVRWRKPRVCVRPSDSEVEPGSAEALALWYPVRGSLCAHGSRSASASKDVAASHNQDRVLCVLGSAAWRRAIRCRGPCPKHQGHGREDSTNRSARTSRRMRHSPRVLKETPDSQQAGIFTPSVRTRMGQRSGMPRASVRLNNPER